MPPVLGWLVGAGLLLWSPLWSARQKMLGILVWPGGYLAVLGLVTVMDSKSCSTSVGDLGSPTDCVSSGPSAWSIIAAIVVLVAPLIVAAYLYRAAGRQADTA